jgi:hypothetical protein
MVIATPCRPETAIRDAVVSAATARYGGTLRAIVLTGSLARGEGTFRAEGDGWRLLGDAELFLVFRDGVAVPPADEVKTLARMVEARLADTVTSAVSLTPVQAAYFRRLRPSIFAYELRACGDVLWGDPTVLSAVPAFEPGDIPLEDAWRLVANRMVEYLEIVDELSEPRLREGTAGHYRTVKLYVDLATSLLVFAGQYAPTYRERARHLAGLAITNPPDDLPPGLSTLAEQVEACTRTKLEEVADVEGSSLDWRDAIAATRRVWRWELERLTGHAGTTELTDEALLLRWLERQPRIDRLRGWLSAARRLGWRAGAASGFAAHRRGHRASPRYCLYAAASALFLRLPALCGPAAIAGRAAVECRGARTWIPFWPGDRAGATPDWRTLATAIRSNYRTFLETTRA